LDKAIEFMRAEQQPIGGTSLFPDMPRPREPVSLVIAVPGEVVVFCGRQALSIAKDSHNSVEARFIVTMNDLESDPEPPPEVLAEPGGRALTAAMRGRTIDDVRIQPEGFILVRLGQFVLMISPQGLDLGVVERIGDTASFQ
jgi:hypothetical protein